MAHTWLIAAVLRRGSVSSIIDHWGDYGEVLQATAGPDGPYGGHWHDMDMLLLGEHELGGLPGITWEEGRTQFGMWSLLAARASQPVGCVESAQLLCIAYCIPHQCAPTSVRVRLCAVPVYSLCRCGLLCVCLVALIMGNDLRNVSTEAKAVLLNEEVIAVVSMHTRAAPVNGARLTDDAHAARVAGSGHSGQDGTASHAQE
eukprot:SAG11_NODE_1650_length_4510_cov_6.795738_6_plen_202_part_00